MRDRNAFVTRDMTGESLHPVPTRPYPTRPALYRSDGHLPSIRHLSDARVERAAAAPSPLAVVDGWMAQSTTITHPLERRAVPPHPAERRDGTCLDFAIVDETSPEDDDVAHIVCCIDDDAALCGIDVKGIDWVEDDELPECEDCARVHAQLYECSPDGGKTCPGCWRYLLGGIR